MKLERGSMDMKSKSKKKKVFLKERLINEEWFQTEKEALTWVMMKRVLVDDQPVISINERINEDAIIRVKEYYRKKYVNKGGLKIEKAIEKFAVEVQDKVALDCGASMGGFTDCLLQHGAKSVYAVDVGHGQLAGKLLIDERVVNLERTNISDEKLLTLDPAPQLITLDLSYLSLKKAVPIALKIMNHSGVLLCLIKPTYEVYNSEVRKDGDINEPHIHKEILSDLLAFFKEINLQIIGLTNSAVRGNNGTIEYVIGLTTDLMQPETLDIDQTIEEAFKLEKFNKNS